MKPENRNAEKEKKIFACDTFKGVDYFHAPSNVSPERSPLCLNMIRSETGKVRKRTGFEFDKVQVNGQTQIKQYEGNINGIHFLHLTSGTYTLMHIGTQYLTNGQVIYSSAADCPSSSVQIGDKLFILDSSCFMCFDGQCVVSTEQNAFVPKTHSGKTPSGQGKKVAQANILTPKRTEGFIADGVSCDYVLSQRNLSSSDVSVIINKDDGTQQAVTNGSGCSVNTISGIVTFSSAPPLSADRQTDNVLITYEKNCEMPAAALNGCKVMTLFGKGGRQDTLFLSGNADYPSVDWWSVAGNPLYFGEDNHQQVGLGKGEIIGYSASEDTLFTHRKSGESNINIFSRKCSGDSENFYGYPVVDTVQGPCPIAAKSFGTLVNENIFLTESGIFAVSKSDVNGQNITQMRSLYINPSLLAQPLLEKACCCVFNDFYFLAVGKSIFVLDGLQKSYEEDKGYSKFQYEAYHWQINEDIRILFVENDRLCFAAQSGKIGRFFTDYSEQNSFNDENRSIYACWQSSQFDGGFAAKNKSIFSLWVTCASAVNTSVKVKGQIKGIWKELFSDEKTARYFKFSSLTWSKLVFSGDKTPKLIFRKQRLKNIEQTAFRFENSELNQPFKIYETGFEYSVGANVK